jgi:hypothetical protein
LGGTTAVDAVELPAYDQRYMLGYLLREDRCVPLQVLSLRTWTAVRLGRECGFDPARHRMSASIDQEPTMDYVGMPWGP